MSYVTLAIKNSEGLYLVVLQKYDFRREFTRHNYAKPYLATECAYVTLAIKNSEGLYLIVLQNMILGENLQGTQKAECAAY